MVIKEALTKYSNSSFVRKNIHAEVCSRLTALEMEEWWNILLLLMQVWLHCIVWVHHIVWVEVSCGMWLVVALFFVSLCSGEWHRGKLTCYGSGYGRSGIRRWWVHLTCLASNIAHIIHKHSPKLFGTPVTYENDHWNKISYNLLLFILVF